MKTIIWVMSASPHSCSPGIFSHDWNFRAQGMNEGQFGLLLGFMLHFFPPSSVPSIRCWLQNQTFSPTWPSLSILIKRPTCPISISILAYPSQIHDAPTSVIPISVIGYFFLVNQSKSLSHLWLLLFSHPMQITCESCWLYFVNKPRGQTFFVTSFQAYHTMICSLDYWHSLLTYLPVSSFAC